MDAVFKALADPTRRAVLDELYRADGQSLSALEQQLPMTRFGVMKHLRVLEEARLVVTKRRGREKLHFLNAVPIQQVHERWVSKYAAPVAAHLTELKRHLEQEHTMEQVYEIYIKATPDQVWEAITTSEARSKYAFGVGVESPFTPGSTYANVHPNMPGGIVSQGENLEVDPPHRLVQTFTAQWSDEVRAVGATRVTWEIEAIGDDSSRLTLTHSELPEGANPELYGGWPMVLSGLKTLLETGGLLTTPGSLMYADH